MVLGLAVGVPGLIDQATGDLLFAPNLRWRNVPLGAILREAFDLPLFVNNEANLAALGEHFFGAAQGYDEVLYISAGAGLGGGIVRGGQLFSGATGFAGEFGHMVIEPDGELCNCGSRGCWETQVSQAALFRYIRQASEAGRATVLQHGLNGAGVALTVPDVIEAARAGDTVALEGLARVGHFLGLGIASLVNALNPELVVFGGILSLAWDFLLPVVQEALHRRALPWSFGTSQVVLAQNGVDACVLGGVATVYQMILSRPATMVRPAI